ncbi:MAG: hypothetical protein HW380_3455 [Magnetococcales bacterium]|nr:hypothetical protein [Magnetococcales bacterium]
MVRFIPEAARLGTVVCVAVVLFGITEAMAREIQSTPENQSLVCWQNGVKIVERTNLAHKEEKDSGTKPLHFVDLDKEKSPVKLYNLGESLCLVQGEPIP